MLEENRKAVWRGASGELFDLRTDPGEQRDLSAVEPGIMARLDAIRRAEDQRVAHPRAP